MAERLAEAAGALPNLSTELNPPDLPARMARSRAVLSTSSLTSYEVPALWKPLAVFRRAEIQTGIGLEIGRRGLGLNLGAWGTWNGEKLRRSLENLPPEPAACVNPRGGVARCAVTEWNVLVALSPKSFSLAGFILYGFMVQCFLKRCKFIIIISEQTDGCLQGCAAGRMWQAGS